MTGLKVINQQSKFNYETSETHIMKYGYNDYFVKEFNFSPLPEFADSLKKTINEYKVVHLKCVPNQIDFKSFYSELVDKIGLFANVEEDIITGNSSRERWTDVRYDKSKDFTFRHSNTRQPLHTDLAYTNLEADINFFFCLVNAEIGGATTFIDGECLLRIMTTHAPDLLLKLVNTKVRFGKGKDQRKVSKIIDIAHGNVKLNWNYFRVSDENPQDVIKLCEEFHNFLEDKIVSSGILAPVHLQVGECVFFKDNAVLHGRYSFLGNRTLIKGGFNLDSH